jgi:site-specific DNA-cytosine methylase
MRILVACEFSGTVRRAFRALGHDAISCDLLPAEDGDNLHHHMGDVLALLSSPVIETFDLMIAHPPCTHLAVSGARWFKEKAAEQATALAFVRSLMEARVSRIAIENPISVISPKIRKPDQIVQPWMFGHGEVKATCLWLKNLPKLAPSSVVDGRHPACWLASPGPDRWKIRSRTYEGIAQAMAHQWGGLAKLEAA